MNVPFDRRQWLLSGAALTSAAAVGLPSLSAAQQAKLIINTYGGRWEKFWRGTLIPPFAKATGIEPTLDIGLGKNFVANIRAAGAGPAPYSIVMINENIASLVRSEGFFEPIPAGKVPNLANVYPNLRNAGDNGVRGIISTMELVIARIWSRSHPPPGRICGPIPSSRGVSGSIRSAIRQPCCFC